MFTAAFSGGEGEALPDIQSIDLGAVTAEQFAELTGAVTTRASLAWDWLGNEYAVNEPRLVPGMGLLVEPAETNSLLRSGDFSNWTESGSMATASSPIADLPASALTEGASSVAHMRYRAAPAVTAGTTYTLSALVKRSAGPRYMAMAAPTTGSAGVAWDLDDLGAALWGWWNCQAAVTQASNRVSAWPDQSGNSRNLIQGSSGAQPLYLATGFNGQPCIEFDRDGTVEFLNANVAALTGDKLTIVLVGEFESTSGNYGRLISTGYPGSASDETVLGAFALQRVATGSGIRTQRNSVVSGTADPGYNKFVLVVQWTGSVVRMRLNGGAWTTGVAQTGAFNIQSFSFFYNLDGLAAEMAWITGDVADADVDRAIGVTAHRWDMEDVLPADFTYKTAPPSSGATYSTPWGAFDLQALTTTANAQQSAAASIYRIDSTTSLLALRWTAGASVTDTVRLAYAQSLTAPTGQDPAVYAGAGTSNQVGGVTLRAGTHPGSPIDTASSPVTRAAEQSIAPVTVPAGPRTFTTSGWAAMGVTTGADQIAWQFDDGTDNSRLALLRTDVRAMRLKLIVAGVEVANLNAGTVQDWAPWSAVVELDTTAGTLAITLAGGTRQSASGLTFPAFASIVYGRARAVGGEFRGVVKLGPYVSDSAPPSPPPPPPGETVALTWSVSGRPTPGNLVDNGPNPRAQWRVNGVLVGSPVEITAVTANGETQQLAYTYEGALSTLTSVGVELLNYAPSPPNPREMTGHGLSVDGNAYALDASVTRTIYNPPGANLVDTGNGLLWKNGYLQRSAPWGAAPTDIPAGYLLRTRARLPQLVPSTVPWVKKPTAPVRARYVSYVSGSNSNDGQTEGAAWKTLDYAFAQVAASFPSGGTEIVLLADGKHDIASGIMQFVADGTDTAWNYIRGKAGERPLLGGHSYQLLQPIGNYCVVEGLELDGSRVGYTSPVSGQVIASNAAFEAEQAARVAVTSHTAWDAGTGIYIDGSQRSGTADTTATIAHHIIIRDCVVHGFPGAGIATRNVDYVLIEDNLVYGNAHWSTYGQSGISVYYPRECGVDDGEGKARITVRRNISYDNRQLKPSYSIGSSNVTDGRGIIFDYFKDQPASYPAYTKGASCYSNLAFNNGASGLHATHSGQGSGGEIDFFNNTTWHNNTESTFAGQPEININSGSVARGYGNIAVMSGAGTAIGTLDGANSTFTLADNITTSAALAAPSSDPATADFALVTGSVAVGAASLVLAAPSDLIRNVKSPADAGAIWFSKTVTGQPAGSAENLSGQANVYWDPEAGNDALAGTTEATAVKSINRVAALMAGGSKTLASKSGSICNIGDGSGSTPWTVAGWANSKWGVYGGTDRARIKNTRVYTGSQISYVRPGVWSVTIPAMGLSTAYAGARVTHALGVIVNDSHICSWYARNGASEVGARTDMYHNVANSNGTPSVLTFASPETPTTVEVMWDNLFHFNASSGLTIQDIDFCGARGHGIVVQSGQENITLQRLRIRRAGITGLYVQPRANTTTSAINTLDCVFEDCHSEGCTYTWVSSGIPVAYRSCKILRNTFRRCCKGPPVIFTSNDSSQDFYSGALKLFTNNWSGGDGWGNDIEVAYNDIRETGNLDVAYVYGSGGYYYASTGGYNSNQAYSFWVDTVTGTTTHHVNCHHNYIESDWSGGIYEENCKPGYHEYHHNVLVNCAQRYNGYAGAIGAGRGSYGLRAYKNTIYAPNALCWSGLFFQAGDGSQNVTDCEFRDNLVVVNAAVAAVHDASGLGATNNRLINNLFWRIDGSAPLFRFIPSGGSLWIGRYERASYGVAAYASARGNQGISGSIQQDPLLTNAAAGDFTLRTGSPALGAASDGGNIGAY